ncbi:Hypothetical protein NTJ_06178 [Nesidiocoris tenuis]|uniref:Uncharacterized protein n=1 Tax=Nesidiocoris tenuis TaxID=355587 RepID=A0ABN7AM98_9HEMI|nr:Hypothetical protein NTJ_06178 [Nesidiocoris tenuis]
MRVKFNPSRSWTSGVFCAISRQTAKRASRDEAYYHNRNFLNPEPQTVTYFPGILGSNLLVSPVCEMDGTRLLCERRVTSICKSLVTQSEEHSRLNRSSFFSGNGQCENSRL